MKQKKQKKTFLIAPFQSPNTQNQAVSVKNDTEETMAFKVKTTAPKLYCVRPNSGVLQPGESTEVTIIFQGLPEEPPLGQKCKDKFLFVAIPCESTINSKDVSTNWAQLEKLAGGKSTDVKLKVIFNYDNPMNTIHEEDKSNIHSFSDDVTTQNDPNATATSTPVADGTSAAGTAVLESIPANTSSIQDKAVTSGIDSNITNPTSTSKSTVPAVEKLEKETKPIVENVEKVEKPSVHVAPPTTSTKSESSSNETNIYLIAIIFIILAFLISRLF